MEGCELTLQGGVLSAGGTAESQTLSPAPQLPLNFAPKSKWVICIHFLVKANLKSSDFHLWFRHNLLGNTRGIIKLGGCKC